MILPLPAFDAATRVALLQDGWRIRTAPAGLTLAVLRAGGAPFKGTKYFDEQRASVDELPVAGGDVAYRPGLMPDSVGRDYAAAERLIADLAPRIPAGARPIIAPAALYVWLLIEHHRDEGAWPLSGVYTWAADQARDGHLAVGVFGRERPLIVSPIPEATGRGIGVMPVIVPA